MIYYQLKRLLMNKPILTMNEDEIVLAQTQREHTHTHNHTQKSSNFLTYSKITRVCVSGDTTNHFTVNIVAIKKPTKANYLYPY